MDGKKRVIIITLVFFLMTVSGEYAENHSAYASSESQRMIQTYGEAELTARPDTARISLAIETHSQSAEEAVEKNAVMANAVRKALLDYGLKEEHLKTGSYQLYSYRNRPKDASGTQREQIEYQATNEIIVSTSQMEAVGKIIDLAVRAGANHINYIHFELENPQDLMLQALEMAIKQASRKADALAKGAGETIIGLKSISEERTSYTPFRLQENMLYREMAMSAEPTPITPAEVSVRATVIAEFSF